MLQFSISHSSGRTFVTRPATAILTLFLLRVSFLGSDQVLPLVFFAVHTFYLVLGTHFYFRSRFTLESSLSLEFLSPGQQVTLLLNQEMLLRPQDRPRPGNPNPPDELSCWEVVVFHCVAPDQRACPAESRFTMHSDGLRVGESEVPLANV